ncbi:TrmB family transcriptional regulator [Haloarchaeobius sp. TZWWS8]|uniref:TrmB family transcriptional regulator n=1 Tax=Haloarchaeobius sp. TZWWS8 TaxID=3446121 RepID=UPI003EBF152E
MSIQQSVTKSAFEPLPETITSPRAKLVYFFLSVADEATVDEIQDSLGMQKLALLSVLKSLAKEGYISKNGNTYSTA